MDALNVPSRGDLVSLRDSQEPASRHVECARQHGAGSISCNYLQVAQHESFLEASKPASVAPHDVCAARSLGHMPAGSHLASSE